MVQANGGAQEDFSNRLVPGVQQVDPATVGDDFAWDSRTALDFLAHIKGRKHYVVANVHEQWVKESDASKLIALLNSTEPCAAVSGTWSSLHDTSPSTIGNEAAFLVEGFRKGHYPPFPHSLQFRFDERRKDELRRWWKDRGEQRSEERSPSAEQSGQVEPRR